jgi:hypothetical protein
MAAIIHIMVNGNRQQNRGLPGCARRGAPFSSNLRSN